MTQQNSDIKNIMKLNRDDQKVIDGMKVSVRESHESQSISMT